MGNLKHGLRHTPEFNSWSGAKSRCNNPNAPRYKDYGGRGIEFKFDSVADIVDDIGRRPEGCSLDRINNDGNYEVGNIRWATLLEQNHNARPKKTAKLTYEQYLELMYYLSIGMITKDVADIYNITTGYVNELKTRRKEVRHR